MELHSRYPFQTKEREYYRKATKKNFSMPIKFRCQHCDQLMGISRSKAGEIVDCPTCGLSVRVPGLDGEIAPIPQPKLDLKDENLTNALDELAAIGPNVTLDKQPNSKQDPCPQNQGQGLANPSPQVKEPTTNEAFKAIPVKQIEQVSVAPQPGEVNPTPLPEPPPVSEIQVVETNVANQTEVSHDDELASLASLAQKRASDVIAEKKKNRLRRSAKFELPTGTWIIILITFAALTFSIGLLVGRNISNTVPAAANTNQN